MTSGTSSFVLGEHGGADADVDAPVEQIIDRAAKPGGPSNGDRHVAGGRAPPARGDLIDDAAGFICGARSLERVELGKVAHEILVRVAQLGRKRLDEVVVVVNAAGEDECQ